MSDLRPCAYCAADALRGELIPGTTCSNINCPVNAAWFSLEEWNTRPTSALSHLETSEGEKPSSCAAALSHPEPAPSTAKDECRHGLMAEMCAICRGPEALKACPEGHQWHETVDGEICAACLLSRPAEVRKADEGLDTLRKQLAASRGREDGYKRVIRQLEARIGLLTSDEAVEAHDQVIFETCGSPSDWAGCDGRAAITEALRVAGEGATEQPNCPKPLTSDL